MDHHAINCSLGERVCLFFCLKDVYTFGFPSNVSCKSNIELCSIYVNLR